MTPGRESVRADFIFKWIWEAVSVRRIFEAGLGADFDILVRGSRRDRIRGWVAVDCETICEKGNNAKQVKMTD